MLSFYDFFITAMPVGVALVVSSSLQGTVTSLCDDIIAPLCSYGLRTGELSTLGVQLGDDPSVILTYGAFLQSVITFIFTLLTVYILVLIFQKYTRVDLTRKLQ